MKNRPLAQAHSKFDGSIGHDLIHNCRFILNGLELIRVGENLAFRAAFSKSLLINGCPFRTLAARTVLSGAMVRKIKMDILK